MQRSPIQVYIFLLECMQQYNCDGTQLQRPLSWKVLHLSALVKVAASEHLDDFRMIALPSARCEFYIRVLVHVIRKNGGSLGRMEIIYETQQEATYVANTCGRDLVIAGMDIWTCFESLESKWLLQPSQERGSSALAYGCGHGERWNQLHLVCLDCFGLKSSREHFRASGQEMVRTRGCDALNRARCRISL